MTATETPDGGMFTGHPQGLFRLFFIEMWERLAFYTMVGVLLLYATDSETGGLGWSKADGNGSTVSTSRSSTSRPTSAACSPTASSATASRC